MALLRDTLDEGPEILACLRSFVCKQEVTMKSRQNPWVRLYRDPLLLSPEWTVQFSDADRAVWIECLIRANGADGSLPFAEDLARMLPGKHPNSVKTSLRHLQDSGWIEARHDGTLAMPNWRQWQPSSDADPTNAERQQRTRERKSNALRHALRNGDVTRAETETEAETEAETDPKDTHATHGSPRTEPGDAPPQVKVSSKAPDNCPHDQIIAAYHEALPSAPRVRIWNDAQKSLLRGRWRENPERQTVGWWKKYFVFVAKSDFLCGRTPARDGRKPFYADLEWLVRPSNMAKVANGRYHQDSDEGRTDRIVKIAEEMDRREQLEQEERQ